MGNLIKECQYKTGNRDLKYHFHTNYEIIFVTEGKAELILSGNSITMEKGDIIFLNNNSYHSIKIVSQPYKRYVVTISTNEFERSFGGSNLFFMFKFNPNQCHRQISIKNTNEIIFLFEKILSEIKSEKDEYSDLLLKSYIEEILIHSNRCADTLPEPENDVKNKILKVQKILENNYHKNIKISDICKEVYISNFYLTHLFTEFTGISPKQYLIQIRLNHAGKLLANKDLSICEVAEKSGFLDTSNFIRCFKKSFGVTPKKFREQL